MSIRLKFTVFIFIVLVIVITGICVSIFFTQKSLLRRQFEYTRQKIFKDFGYTCKEALVVKDELLVLNTIRSIIQTHNPQIVYAGYISAANMKFLSVRDRDYETEFQERISHAKEDGQTIQIFYASNNEEIYEFSMPIKDKGSYLGTIIVGFSQDYLNSEIKKATNLVIKKILEVAIVAALLSLIFAYLLAFYMVKPIKKLAEASIELGSGNLDVKVDIKRKDEIGYLAKTFNEMAEKLKQLDELKDSFVSSVSHELRSPLAAIDGYVDYLMDGIKEGGLPLEKQQKALTIIKDSVNRLTTFINNILDLAKIKAGKFELHKMPVKIEEIINEIVLLFQQMAAKQQKVINVELEQNLPSVFVDPERIKQVLTNLIGNALKFTQADAKITVSARVVKENVLKGYIKEVPKDVAGKYIEVAVSDTGCGIPENELEKIFDKFYQVGATSPNKPKGTGLGLSIAAEIVRFHNGAIGVESVLGKGSTFKFILPIWKQ